MGSQIQATQMKVQVLELDLTNSGPEHKCSEDASIPNFTHPVSVRYIPHGLSKGHASNQTKIMDLMKVDFLGDISLF